jgi:hypothetical protein
MNETNKWSISGSTLKYSGASTFLYSWNKALAFGWNSAQGEKIARWIVDNQDKPHFPKLPDQEVKRWCNLDMNGSAFRNLIEHIQANYPGLTDVMVGKKTLESHLFGSTSIVASVEFDLSNFQTAAQVYALLEQLKAIAPVKVEIKKA